MDDGKERSMFGMNFTNHRNVWIYSINTSTTMNEVDSKGMSRLTVDEIPIKKNFAKWIMENYTSILTEKQIAYVECTEEERREKYNRKNRWWYRNTIQKSLMKSYFNGIQIQYYARLHYDLEKLNILRKLKRKSTDNVAFVTYIIENLDSNYINDLIYGNRITTETFRDIQKVRTTGCKPNINSLNEIYEIVLLDIEATKQHIMSYKI